MAHALVTRTCIWASRSLQSLSLSETYGEVTDGSPSRWGVHSGAGWQGVLGRASSAVTALSPEQPEPSSSCWSPWAAYSRSRCEEGRQADVREPGSGSYSS